LEKIRKYVDESNRRLQEIRIFTNQKDKHSEEGKIIKTVGDKKKYDYLKNLNEKEKIRALENALETLEDALEALEDKNMMFNYDLEGARCIVEIQKKMLERYSQISFVIFYKNPDEKKLIFINKYFKGEINLPIIISKKEAGGLVYCKDEIIDGVWVMFVTLFYYLLFYYI
jgi:hypothetical protein